MNAITLGLLAGTTIWVYAWHRVCLSRKLHLAVSVTLFCLAMLFTYDAVAHGWISKVPDPSATWRSEALALAICCILLNEFVRKELAWKQRNHIADCQLSWRSIPIFLIVVASEKFLVWTAFGLATVYL